MDDHFDSDFMGELPFEFVKPERNDALRDKSWQDLSGSMTAGRRNGMKRRRPYRAFVIGALLLVVCGGLYLFWGWNHQKGAELAGIRTGDFQKTITLPDGSVIYINRFSEIRADTNGWSDSKREVWLKGEAFFEIRKLAANSNGLNTCKPFMVHMEKGDIEVLGTSFNIITDSLGFSTSLNTGKIRAHIGKEEQVTLTPGQALVVCGNTFYKKNINVQLYSAWKDGEFHFDHTDIAEVSELIRRYYKMNVHIDHKVLSLQKKLSGDIAVKDSGALFNALRAISGLQIKTIKDSLFITK